MKVYFLYLKKTNRLYGYTADRNIKDRFLLERNPKCFYCKKEKMTDEEFVRFKNDESILELSLHPFYLSRKKCTELVATYHEIEKLTKICTDMDDIMESARLFLQDIEFEYKYQDAIRYLSDDVFYVNSYPGGKTEIISPIDDIRLLYETFKETFIEK